MKLSELWKHGNGVPTTGDIPIGGLAVDTTNGKMYSKKINGAIFEVGAFNFNEEDLVGLEAVIAQHSVGIEENAAEIVKLWNTPSIKADQSIINHIKYVYDEYLGRVPDEISLVYWTQEVNFGNISFNDLEYSIYVAAQENGETLLKVYVSPEDAAQKASDEATISAADVSLVSTIRSWYSIILHNYTPDSAGIAYWIREVQQGRIVEADMDEAIFNAAFGTKSCYAIPDTLVSEYELGTNGIAKAKTTATEDDLVIPITTMGEVSIVNGNVVVASDPDNNASYITAVTANPTRSYKIVTYYNKYFGRNPSLDGVYYWLNDGTLDADLERAIFVAGSMNGETSTGVAFAGTQFAQMVAELQAAITALSAAQASGSQTAINTAQSTLNTTQTNVNNYNTAGTTAATQEPTRAEAITAMYTTYLGREPDSAGLNYWINDSLSIEQIEAIISQGEH